MLLEVLPDLVSKEDLGKAKVVVLMLGSNDASFPETNPEQAVSVEEFGENLLKIVAFLLSQGVKKEALVLVSPPPVLPEVWTAQLNNQPGPKQANCKSEALTKSMGKEVEVVAKRLGVTFVDLHLALSGSGVNLSDGLHLGRQGSATLASLLVPEMHNKLSTNPESPLLMPLWRDLDNADVAKSYSHWKST